MSVGQRSIAVQYNGLEIAGLLNHAKLATFVSAPCMLTCPQNAPFCFVQWISAKNATIESFNVAQSEPFAHNLVSKKVIGDAACVRSVMSPCFKVGCVITSAVSFIIYHAKQYLA
jgi:hypothetical protein